jgi:N,N'-diacetyllegionaminate synthase
MILIAELSTNHGGDVDLACEMVRQAAEAGATYAKIQTYSLERLNPTDPQADWLRQAHLDEAAHVRIFQACKDAGIQPLSTPFDVDSLKMLRRLGLKTFKIASSESAAEWWGRQKGERWLVSYPWGLKPADTPQCIVALTAIPLYPTPLEAVGRAALLQGWSDHTCGLAACQWAIANGAKALEVHMKLSGRGRECSWDKTPAELRVLRDFADDCETLRSGVATRFRERWQARA